MALIKVKSNGVDDTTNLGRRNILINGAMRIHQRGNQTSSQNNQIYFIDRFNFYHNSSTAVANLQQSTDVPSGQGFSNSLLMDITTIDSAPGSTAVAVLRQIIEGHNLQHLAYGTGSAKTITLSFWVKSPKTGTHIIEIYHLSSPTNRTISKSYTVNSANTWEYKKIQFPGDTAQTIANNNAYAFAVQWPMFAGGNFTSGTLQTTWGNLTNANRFVGQQNLFDNTSNNFFITGTQLEVGNMDTPFEHIPFGEELSLCQRYYTKSWAYGNTVNTNPGVITAACVGNVNRAFGNVFWPTEMRTTPTVTWYSGSNGTVNKWRNGSTGTDINPPSAIAAIGTKGYGYVLSSGISSVTDTLQGHYEAIAEL